MNTFSGSSTGPLTIDMLIEAREKIMAIPENDQWIIVTLEGEVFQGNIEQALRLLVPRHPLLKPLSFPTAYD